MAKNNIVNAGYWFTQTNAHFPISKIDTNLYTHLFCGYANLNSQTYELSFSDSAKPLIRHFSNAVKENNSKVKTLLSIGGDHASAESFAAMAATSSNRASFIGSFICKAREGNFDGVDVQWLYPSCAEDMSNFEALIIECHNGVVQEAKESRQPRLILVATVFYSPYINDVRYPIQVIRGALDWVNVIAYDIYTPTSSTNETGPSSAFYNPERNSSSGYFGIRTWIQQGLPSKMIVFGLPFHGWAWKLESSKKHKVFSPAQGPARGQNISMEGLIEYGNIKKFIADNDANNVPMDRNFVIGYTNFGSTWIAYEDEDTIKFKISSVKTNLGLSGYFVWNIAADDEHHSLAKLASREWKKGQGFCCCLK
ncbi:Class V chitinase, partial [Cucurbita argyrosperma subsp. sororia]